MGSFTFGNSAAGSATVPSFESVLMTPVSIFLLDFSTPRAKNTANSGEDRPRTSQIPAHASTGIYDSIQPASTHPEERYGTVQAPSREDRRSRRRLGIRRVSGVRRGLRVQRI